MNAARSGAAIDGHGERSADLAHLFVAEATEALNQHSDRNALNRVQVHRTAPSDRVLSGVEDNFARQSADGCGARGDKRATQARNRDITRQHDDRPTSDLRRFAPPQLTAQWCGHTV